MTVKEYALSFEDEDDIVGIGTVDFLRRTRTNELVGFVDGFEHFSAFGVFVRMVLLGQPEVSLWGDIQIKDFCQMTENDWSGQRFFDWFDRNR